MLVKGNEELEQKVDELTGVAAEMRIKHYLGALDHSLQNVPLSNILEILYQCVTRVDSEKQDYYLNRISPIIARHKLRLREVFRMYFYEFTEDIEKKLIYPLSNDQLTEDAAKELISEVTLYDSVLYLRAEALEYFSVFEELELVTWLDQRFLNFMEKVEENWIYLETPTDYEEITKELLQSRLYEVADKIFPSFLNLPPEQRFMPFTSLGEMLAHFDHDWSITIARETEIPGIFAGFLQSHFHRQY